MKDLLVQKDINKQEMQENQQHSGYARGAHMKVLCYNVCKKLNHNTCTCKEGAE
jgi:hypothetical protein